MPVSLRKSLPSAFCILLGSLLYAFTVHLFILPGKLMSSGTTGIALTVCRLTGIPLSRFILCFNLVMLFAGLVFLGRRFFFSTLPAPCCIPFAWILPLFSFLPSPSPRTHC